MLEGTGALAPVLTICSRLGASPEHVEKLRAEHGVYMVGDSRINVAGLPEDRLDRLAAAVLSVMGEGA